MKKNLLLIAALFVTFYCSASIDRTAVLQRNSPTITAPDALNSLSVGNGQIAMTVDITGLQSFPTLYKQGVPLTTMSQWGWHSEPNTMNIRPEDSQMAVETQNGHGAGMYASEFKHRPNGKSDTERQIAATVYLRQNPHRLNLGLTGLLLLNKKGERLNLSDLKHTRQHLDLETGVISSEFFIDNDDAKSKVSVRTACSQSSDALLSSIESRQLKSQRVMIAMMFPYPSMQHSDDAADWTKPNLHTTKLIEQGKQYAIIERTLDATTYFVRVSWEGEAEICLAETHCVVLCPTKRNKGTLNLRVEYMESKPESAKMSAQNSITNDIKRAGDAMKRYWQEGAFVDFGECSDPRAPELERRVVLSQYLMRINEYAPLPPQEAGLTYNTWFGRPHMEMIWWHSLQWSLWNRQDVLAGQMKWYEDVAPICRQIAQRQHYKGLRWLKMTDPWGGESPSNVGSFLVWQQPHYIYLAEELYRRNPSKETLKKYSDLLFETAEFMSDFVVCDSATGCYHLKGCTSMQESIRWTDTYDPTFDVEYWIYGLSVAQTWRERLGLARNAEWDDIINNMVPLAERDGIYQAARSYGEISDSLFCFYSSKDHPAVLGALGMLPEKITNRNISHDKMKATFMWIKNHWDWKTTWGWDYGMTAMAAARLGMGDEAINALLMNTQKNMYLTSGHNYQDARLRVYLPGNGALLATIAMMAAGWDGCPNVQNPGFPHDGKWNVKWEGLKKMQ